MSFTGKGGAANRISMEYTAVETTTVKANVRPNEKKAQTIKSIW